MPRASSSSTATYLFMSTFHLQKEVKQCIWMWIKTSSKLPWHWFALVFCLYEFGSPDLKRCPSHFFKGPPVTATGTNQVLLAPRRLYVSIMRSVLPEDKSGNPGTERILRNPSSQPCVGGRGSSHISEIWRDEMCLCCLNVVYCNVVCLNMIWFLVLLDPFQTNTSPVLFMLFWILKDIPCISQWSQENLQFPNTWSFVTPPNFFVGGAQNARYPMIIFLPFFLS